MRLLIFLTLFFSCPFADAASKNKCTRDEAAQAESRGSELKSWREVYKSYKQFAHCDDGAIAEGFSASISNLLARDWAHFNELVKLVESDKGFEKFFIKHVDELKLIEDGKKIMENVGSRCPPKNAHLCKQILDKIKTVSPGNPG